MSTAMLQRQYVNGLLAALFQRKYVSWLSAAVLQRKYVSGLLAAMEIICQWAVSSHITETPFQFAVISHGLASSVIFF